MVYLMNRKEKKPIKILVAVKENNMKRIWGEFQKARLGNPVCIVKSGYEALDFLYQFGKFYFSKPEKPDLILLSTELADIKAADFIRYINLGDAFSKIPIVLLGSSCRETLSGRIDLKGGIHYLPKPFNYRAFFRKLRKLEIKWSISKDLPVCFFRNRNRGKQTWMK